MESKDGGAFRGRRSSRLLAILFALSTVSSSKAQVFHTLLSFPGGTLGADPPTRSLVAGSGNFFGATSQGGDTSCDPGFGCGVIYELTSSGTETVLHSITGATGGDGAQPNVSDGSEPDTLVLNKEALCGTTFQGGNANGGTVFEITPQ